MLASAGAFALVIWDGDVTRLEGAGLLVLAIWLLIWLYRASPVFVHAEREGEGDAEGPPPSRIERLTKSSGGQLLSPILGTAPPDGVSSA